MIYTTRNERRTDYPFLLINDNTLPYHLMVKNPFEEVEIQCFMYLITIINEH